MKNINVFRKIIWVIILGLATCSAHLVFAQQAQLSASVNNTTENSVDVTLFVSGTLAKSYAFNLKYSLATETQSLTADGTTCSFDQSSQTFSNSGTKGCIFQITGLQPAKQYYYRLSSNPGIPFFALEGNFTTNAASTLQNDGLCGLADVSNSPSGVSVAPATQNDLCYQGAASHTTSTTSNGVTTGWTWTCAHSGSSGSGSGSGSGSSNSGSGHSVGGNANSGNSSGSSNSNSGSGSGSGSSSGSSSSGSSGSGSGDACGNQNLETVNVQPTYASDLCSQGTMYNMQTTSDGWSWSCGDNGTKLADCSAYNGNGNSGNGSGTPGSCGTATTDTALTAIPSGAEALCLVGLPYPTTPTGDGSAGNPWTWTCDGINGGPSSPTCTATIASSGAGAGAGSGADAGTATSAAGNFLVNPFKSLDSFPKIIAAVINNIILPIAVPFIAVMLIYCGILFVLARKEGGIVSLQRAKTTLIYTLIGAALVLGAFVVANAIQGTLNNLLATIQSINPFV